MNNRLQKIITQKGISSGAFADEIGVQRSSISHILSGRNLPSFEFIQKLLHRYPELNPDWVIHGKGEMLRTITDNPVGSTSERPAEGSLFVRSEDPLPYFKKETVGKIEENVKKIVPPMASSIEKIVIFYADKTFVEYKSKVDV